MAGSNYTDKDVALPQSGNQLPLPPPLHLTVPEHKPFCLAKFQGENDRQPEEKSELSRDEREWKAGQRCGEVYRGGPRTA